jgi:hypothetical protein
MKRIGVSPLRLAIAGTACYVGSLAWVAISAYVAHRNDPPGWIVDRASPTGAYYLAAFGGFLLLCAFFSFLVALVKHFLFR